MRSMTAEFILGKVFMSTVFLSAFEAVYCFQIGPDLTTYSKFGSDKFNGIDLDQLLSIYRQWKTESADRSSVNIAIANHQRLNDLRHLMERRGDVIPLWKNTEAPQDVHRLDVEDLVESKYKGSENENRMKLGFYADDNDDLEALLSAPSQPRPLDVTSFDGVERMNSGNKRSAFNSLSRKRPIRTVFRWG